MDARDLFLDQHAAVHSAAVGGNKMSAVERALGGVSDEQMRVRPREDLNSIAWILWHIARAEDIFVNPVLAGRSQVLDDAWVRRLGVDRRDFGIGMSKDEVSDLTGRVDLGALREYRDAVGKRTREVVGGFKSGGLGGPEPGGRRRARRRRGGVRRAVRDDRQGLHGAAPRDAPERTRAVPPIGASRRGRDRAQRGRIRHGG